MSNQQKKAPRSELLMTVVSTQPLLLVGVNTAAASAKLSTPLVKTGSTPPSTINLPQRSSNLTESERENALLAAGIFASTLPTLLKAGLLRRARNQQTGEALLVLPQETWDNNLKLRDK